MPLHFFCLEQSKLEDEMSSHGARRSMYLVDMGAGVFNACDAGFSDHGSGDRGGDLRGSKAYATSACVQQQESIRLVPSLCDPHRFCR